MIDDLTENSVTIKAFIGDNPKRAEARAALQHGALYPCEYCFQKGTTYQHLDETIVTRRNELQFQLDVIQDRINKHIEQQEQRHEQEEPENENDFEQLETMNAIKASLIASIKDISKKKSQVVWPASSRNGELRTVQKVKDIVTLIENDHTNELSRDDKKGIVGKSPLLDLEYFNIVSDVPTEYLHSVCLGGSKRLTELTFNVGVTRTRVTRRQLSSPSTFNALMAKIKVPREFPRRARSLDFAVMKGTEFRNLCLFFFPIILECIPRRSPERKLWLYFAYLLRACTIPSKEFQNLDDDVIEYCSANYYSLYEKTFSCRNCTYNTHVVFSHMEQMRFHGPLTETSAFGFENFYGELRRSFTPGTISPLKQIMGKVYLKRKISYHQCAPNIYLSNYETALESNNYIYTFVHRQYQIYRIIDIEHEQTVSCKKIKVKTSRFAETPTLNWKNVGVFERTTEEEEEGEEIVQVERKFIAGKMIKVLNLFITCPNNILEEK